jgi:asparagine synthase (glutamine-hydrolysing)
MCGIAGIMLRRGAVDRRQLDVLAATLAHRGPDDRGLHAAGSLGIIQTRLSIIDLAGGHQPLYSDDGTLCLVANGEIYNYVELRRELERRGHRFATHSDCEPLLYAYREWGPAFVDRVHGMFAFALHDAAQGRLLLARDRLGIKPLFIADRAEGLYFASELKSLFKVLPERPAVDPDGLVQYLESNFSSGRTTLVKGLERILPGEIVTAEHGVIKERRRYWSPLHVRPAVLDFATAAEAFAALMAEVIPQHLRSDVPCGLFLSGGLDSSILLALLQQYGDRPLHTYSVGFASRDVHNELPRAAELARRFATVHTEVVYDRDTLFGRLPRCIWAADELMGDYANLPTSMLGELAGADVKVVFSGEGGDEVFAGYGRYRMPAVRRWLRQLRAPGSGGFRTRGAFSAMSRRRLFNPALERATAQWRHNFTAAWQACPSDWSRILRMQYVDLMTWLPDDLLVKADRMLMAWGVEGRVPFLDHRVVEFGLSLPDDLKVSGRNGKVFLKRWGARVLPGEDLWTRKRGFTVPIRHWLGGPMLERLMKVLPDQPGVADWFQPDGVREVIARQQRRGDAGQVLWALLQFAVWHRLYVEGDGAMPSLHQDPVELIS